MTFSGNNLKSEFYFWQFKNTKLKKAKSSIRKDQDKDTFSI